MSSILTAGEGPAPGAASEQGFVSVLIVNWNTREHLATCVEALEHGALPERGEVIVVDNASSDGSAEMVAERFPWVHLVRNSHNLGFARGVNQAAERAHGDLLLFLNSDTVPANDTIDICRAYLLAHDDVAVVGCRLTFPDGRPQSSAFRFPSLRGVLLTSLWLSQAFPNSRTLNWDRYGNRQWSEASDVDVTMGSFLLLRRAAIQGPAPLDEGYFIYGEESDMCRQLRENGWRTVHLPSASLVHVHGGSTKTPELEGWATEAKARGVLRFICKWQGATSAWLANLLMLIAMLPRLLVWGTSDLVRGLRSGRLRALRWKKGRVIRYHVAVLVRPSTLRRRWTGPDELRTDHS